VRLREISKVNYNHRTILPGGTILADTRIIDILGAGGFGVTYRAAAADNTLVAIKEYYPADLATRVENHRLVPLAEGADADYRWGLNRFNEEARTLLQFRHPNIVQVQRLLQLNNTAYMVLTFENGATLRRWCKDRGRAPSQLELDALLEPLLAALDLIHTNSVLHRDLSPDNILVRTSGAPVLIDFGSARLAVGQRGAMSAIVKHGFSPHEQYATDPARQGPWSDIYALAATLYFLITGKPPPQAINRLERDSFGGLARLQLTGYRTSFLAVIDAALVLNYRARPQTVRAWRSQLFADRQTMRPQQTAPGPYPLNSEPQQRQDGRALGNPIPPAGLLTPVGVPPPPAVYQPPVPSAPASIRRPARRRSARRVLGWTLLLFATVATVGLALVVLRLFA
jgi:serine/threonine protein kinase